MANVEIGRKVAVGLARETTRGTAVAPAYWAKHLSLDFMQKSDKQYNESGMNVLDKFNESEVMKDWGEGKLEGKISDKTFGLILTSAFGAAPTTTTNADASTLVKDHTFAQNQTSEGATLTVGLKDTLRDERYALGALDSLDLNIEAGQWAKFTATYKTKKPSASAGNTVVYVAENEFKGKFAVVKLAANVAGLSGASAITLRTLKLSINRNVDPYFALGSNDPNNIINKEVEIKGDFVALFDAVTHRDTFLNNTYQAMSITLTNTDVTIGTAANPKLVLTFPKVSFSNWGVDQGLGNIVEQTLGIQPVYSLTDGYTWSSVLTNLVTSY